MGLLVKARSATIADFTLQFKGGIRKEHPMELLESVLPAEWFPQSGVMITWPHAATDWAPIMKDVTDFYVKLSFHISNSEGLLIVTPEAQAVHHLLIQQLPAKNLNNIRFCSLPTNDTWTRDHGPLFVREEGRWKVKDFGFNGWGNKFPSALDNAIPLGAYRQGWLKGDYVDCLDFTLEGGSLESDGRGTLMLTSHCLLHPNRNPSLNQENIEFKLQKELHAHRLLWLHHGHLAGDDTDGHIDTLARFCPDDTIVYVKCNQKHDEHYAELSLMEQELMDFRTAGDRPYRLLPLPLPDPIFCDGERLPATYANFLVINNEVLMPTYGQPDNDEQAHAILQQAFPTHAVTGIDSRALIKQHGSLHCSTMQIPKGILQI